jgi:lipopolysaccharide transport protein LptA
MKKLLGIVSFSLLFGAGLIYAGSEPVKITARKVSGDSEKKIAYIEGNVRIIQGKTLITTEYVTINLDQKTASLAEGVKLENPDATIESGHLEYNLKQKSGTFQDQVVLKRIESKDQAKDPFELNADQLYFESETKNFKARDHCRIKHKEFEGKAENIEYDDAGQQLVFKSKVVIQQGKTIIKTEAATINLRNKELRLETDTVFTSREINIKGGGLEYDYDKKVGTFYKDIVLERGEVKNTRGKVTKEPFKLTAGSLYFETETNNFSADQGQIEHKEFTGSAGKIEYDDKLQRLIFHGNAILIRFQGDKLQGDLIEINLQEQSFTVHKNGDIKLRVQEKK